MKRILFLFIALLSLGAQAQTTIKVLHVFTADARYYAQQQGLTMAQFVDSQVAQANAAFAASGANVQLQNVGIRSDICCGSSLGFTYLPPSYPGSFDGEDGGLLWGQRSIPIAQERDLTGADITVLIGNYYDISAQTPIDAPGTSASVCNSPSGTPAPSPKTAMVGVNIQPQLFTDPLTYVHEVAHLLCMRHEDVVQTKTGSNQGDCKLTTTAERTNHADPYYPAVTTACWKLPGKSTCYPSGHAAVLSVAQENVPPIQSCTYTYIGSTSTSWDESMNCPGWGYASWHSDYVTTVVTPSFKCTNLDRLKKFSPTTAGKINAQASNVVGFRNTKLAPKLKEAVAVAIEAAQ